MTEQELQEFSAQWLNGVGVGFLWDKVKAAFLSGMHNQQSSVTIAWKQQARANIDLSIGVNQIWYGSAANTIGLLNTSQIGRNTLNASSSAAIEGLWSEKATKDGAGHVIQTNFAHNLVISTGYLRLKDYSSTPLDLAAIELNGGNGLVQLTSGKIPLGVMPDSILGQMTYGGNITSYGTVSDVEYIGVSITDSAKAILAERTGKTFGTKAVRLVAVASSSKPADTDSALYFNYEDCAGMYFIWTAAALASHTGEPDYRIWPSGEGNPRYQSGDWLSSLESEWGKVDNTDAVTGVKGVMESSYKLGNVILDALNVGALATYATQSHIQSVADEVNFGRSIYAQIGVAAGGIASLAINTGGGGTGTVTSVKIGNGEPIESVDGLITIPTDQIENQEDGTVALGGVALTVKGLGQLAYKSSLTLSEIGNSADLQAIEALTGTGMLKRTDDNTWALRDAAGIRSDAGITGDIYTHNHSEYVTALGVSGDTITWSKGGSAQPALTLNYAKTTSRFKSESFTNQEFTFRKTPKTIDTDSMRLDRINGKTLVWNQVVNRATSPETGGTKSRSNYVDTITNGTYAVYNSVYGSNPPSGHKYYLSVRVAGASAGTVKYGLNWSNAGREFATFSTSITTSLARYSAIIQNTSYDASWGNISVRLYWSNNNLTIDIGNSIIVDLTLMFGSGNEPTLADFESKYLPKYYSYNAGELINNSAKAIESVGFNLWDEEWEAGYFYESGGTIHYSTNSNTIRSKNYIEVTPSTEYYGIRVNTSSAYPYPYRIAYFDANKKFIGAGNLQGYTFTTPANARFIKFFFEGYSVSYARDICINLSDTSKNGTYKPYKKTITDLNLQEIRVKSPNIWDEEWELGDIQASTGELVVASDRIRSKNFIPIEPNTSYYTNSDKIPWAIFYDSNYNFVGYRSVSSKMFTSVSNAQYLKFYCLPAYGTTYNNDITINVSDSAFNGRYFPHGVITFNGLKSAGSVYDEITNGGRTLISRIGKIDLGSLTWTKYNNEARFTSSPNLTDVRDSNGNNTVCPLYIAHRNSNVYGDLTDKYIVIDSNGMIITHDEAFLSSTGTQYKVALSGVYLYYELKNYETYELVEPIPTAMPAGTTERRLPEDTSDSVLAPFACDMTYGAQMADVLTLVPFADKATRLATKHTIFGHDFDGTQDVIGNLSDITNINSLLYFDSTNGRIGVGQSSPTEKLDVDGKIKGTQLISTVATGTAPFAVTSTTKVNNLNADKLDGYEASGLFESMLNDNDQLKIQIGNSAKSLTLDYATLSLDAKTEVKTGQEFAFRQTGGGTLTKPYSSGVIKRMLGNSMVWNQLYQFKNRAAGASISYDSTTKIITVTTNGSSGYVECSGDTDTVLISAHKYYLRANIIQDSDSIISSILIQAGGNAHLGAIINNINGKGSYSSISTGKYTASAIALFNLKNYTTANRTAQLKLTLVDLTLFFNGNIPTGLTAETFERDYGYLLANPEYNAGTLINNACSGLESVGFNLWDEEWEIGDYDMNTGQTKSGSGIRSKSTSPIPVIGGQTYYLRCAAQLSSGSVVILRYDANDNYLGYSYSGLPNGTFAVESNCKYIRFVFSSTYGSTYNNDICINISNSSKNGTHEPYKRNVLPLNLNSFRVKDAQGNIITITGGLGDANNQRDEIIAGTRFIKRTAVRAYQSGDESDTTVKTDKTNTRYALTTPIEYEIIDDFPTSYPIDVLGTERIVSDELVAPFIADIQYGAKQNDFAWDIDHLASTLKDIKLASGPVTDATVSSASNNGEWYELQVGVNKLFLRFVTADTAFKLQIADDKTNPTMTKEFAFATLSQNDIDTICV